MKNFEDSLRKLEELSNAIKSPDISLEDALKSFEEGIKLAKGLEKELDSMEGKIQKLMNSPAQDDVFENDPESTPEESSDEKKKKSTRTKKTKDDKDMPILDLFTPNTEVNGTRNG